MSFITDKQTQDDLNLLGKHTPHSIYSLFNKVKTPGGEKLLEEMFRYPLKNPREINLRSSIFRHFQDKKVEFPLSGQVFGLLENYLGLGTANNFIGAAAGILWKKLSASLLHDDQFMVLHSGLLASVSALQTLQDFLQKLEENEAHPYSKELHAFKAIFSDPRLQSLLSCQNNALMPLSKTVKYDFLLRYTLRAEMEKLLGHCYCLDVYIAVAHVAQTGNFSYALALPKDKNVVTAKELRHPGIEHAIGNELSFHQNNNLMFLTGANMAGKSTFMKTFGISMYLAHMGFPVAAEEMIFSVKDGIYSSINVPDNLSLGLSHFYAEVLRVKTVAEEVADGKNLVVIFDELFKGTNVKDAFDATLAVTKVFSKYRNCWFIISTHIIEVGEALQQDEGIQFRYLPTVMEGKLPHYTYQLNHGITADRHGMMIIENEGILEMI